MCCTGCGVDCEHVAAAGMCRMSCGLVSLFVVAVRRSRLRHDHRHDLCRIGNALLNSNMAGHMVVARRTMGAQVPGTWSELRHLQAFILRLRSLRSLLSFAFCMSTMSNVLTFDSAVAPATTGGPCSLGKCSLMSQKFIAGLHAVCAPCPTWAKGKNGNTN